MIAEGFYSWDPPKDVEHPTYDELLADNTAKLREQIQTASQRALDTFKTGVLKPAPRAAAAAVDGTR